MSNRLLLFLAVLILPAVMGCQAVSGVPAPSPTPVLLDPAPLRVHEFVPGVHQYVSESERLVIPTLTPTPVPTLRPPPVFSAPLPEVSSADLRVVADEAVEPLSCTAQYRLSMVEYRGRIPFGAEVAQELAEALVQLRPECAGEDWGPELASGRACLRGRISGVPISPGLTGRSNPIALPVPLTSGRDELGNILVHFARVPGHDSPGCWYYTADRGAWAWLVLGGDFGVDRRPFPVCDRRLRELVSDAAGPGFGPADVARALDEVRLDLPVTCGSPLWDLFPSALPHEDCGSPSGTSIDGDGALVVSWHTNHTPSDYAVCWVLPAGADVWDVYYVQDDPEDEF